MWIDQIIADHLTEHKKKMAERIRIEAEEMLKDRFYSVETLEKLITNLEFEKDEKTKSIKLLRYEIEKYSTALSIRKAEARNGN